MQVQVAAFGRVASPRVVLFSRSLRTEWAVHKPVIVSERPVSHCPSLSVGCVRAFSPPRFVAFKWRSVGARSVAYVLQKSPKVALAPVLQGLRRAALANKCVRIAERLARLRRAGEGSMQ
jgi:hypothetical protein